MELGRFEREPQARTERRGIRWTFRRSKGSTTNERTKARTGESSGKGHTPNGI
jgi:hypothetical protein